MENRVKITVNVDYSKKSFFSFVKLLVPSMRNGLIFLDVAPGNISAWKV